MDAPKLVDRLRSPVGHLPLPATVVQVGLSDSLADVLGKLKAHNIGSLVAVDEQGVLQGIFTERDFIRKVAGEGVDLDQAKIEDFMTPNPKTVCVDDPILKAAVAMRMGRFRHVVVVDEDKNVKSMISIKDILDWLVDSE